MQTPTIRLASAANIEAIFGCMPIRYKRSVPGNIQRHSWRLCWKAAMPVCICPP